MEANMDRVVKELRRVDCDAEGLLEAGGDRLGDTCEAMVTKLQDARERQRDLEHAVPYRSKRAARQVDHYAFEHPRQIAAIGVALATAEAVAAWLQLDSRRE